MSVTDAKPLPAADIIATETTAEPTAIISHDKKINLLIDIENSIKAKDSPGYERWAQGFNLQQAAETLMFLQTNNLTDMDALTHAANQAQTDYDVLQQRIDAADARIKDVNALQRHIGAYSKNRNIYAQYLRSKRNPKFRKENEKAIITVEEAKAYFDSLGLDKLPTIKELQAEFSVLYQEKQNCYQARNAMRQSVFDLQSAKKNVEIFLGIDSGAEKGRTKKKGIDTDI
jgi:septal ring factor EnvC (AmiA/AmiB activator)